jgi:hypothetical protein
MHTFPGKPRYPRKALVAPLSRIKSAAKQSISAVDTPGTTLLHRPLNTDAAAFPAARIPSASDPIFNEIAISPNTLT